MTGLNPGSANGARPRPALLAAGPDPASDQDVNDMRSGSGSCACRRNQQ
jgi:hypothetical protein